jgi:hypothetical protein
MKNKIEKKIQFYERFEKKNSNKKIRIKFEKIIRVQLKILDWRVNLKKKLNFIK